MGVQSYYLALCKTWGMQPTKNKTPSDDELIGVIEGYIRQKIIRYATFPSTISFILNIISEKLRMVHADPLVITASEISF